MNICCKKWVDFAVSLNNKGKYTRVTGNILCPLCHATTKIPYPTGPKVYCGECRYYSGNEVRGWCKHDNNSAPTFYSKHGTYARCPTVINKNNDCEWFRCKDE